MTDMQRPPYPMHILVDADACPVKEEIYRVAARHRVPVKIVSNSPFRVPDSPLVTRVVVSDAFDAADDWIAKQSGPGGIVITSDILLADRAIKAGAEVLAPNGKPFSKFDRSQFLQALDQMQVRLARGR